MESIFDKLGRWFKPNSEKQIKVIGFYTSNNTALFIYNVWDDRFDNSTDIDLSDKSFKYENATMLEAQVCMDIEGNVGELQELSLFI
jgi:hypothetical protein